MNSIDDLKMLLPFYVNGTLDAENCARIDQGLASSLDLRKELDEINALAQNIREGGLVMMQVQDDVDHSLKSVLDDPRMKDADVPQVHDHDRNSTLPSQGLLSFLNPKNWHPAVSLALVAAAVAQAGLLAGLTDARKTSGEQVAKLEKRVGDLEYQLASGPGGGAAKPDILIQVKPNTPWSELSELLSTEGLNIVDGPSDNTVSVSSELEGAALDAVIVRLRASVLIDAADKAA
jgi:hypothetical protein